MRVTWLSGNENAPCFLLEWENDDLRVVVDGMLWLKEGSEFDLPFPEDLDWSTVDAIILTHHDYWTGIPLLFDRGLKGEAFNGRIYATLPTLKLGELVCNELCAYYTESLNVLPDFYSVKHIEKIMSFAVHVGFGEIIKLKPNIAFSLSSAGASLGSSNLVVTQLDGRKCGYISCASMHTFRYPAPLDTDALADLDSVIFATKPTAEADEFVPTARALGRLVLEALESSKTVAIPVTPAGMLFDIVEILHEGTKSTPFGSLKINFVSPVAREAFFLVGILGEWMSEVPQNNLYIPQPPLLFERTNASWVSIQERFVTFPDIQEMFASSASSNIVLAGHASCSFGAAKDLLNTNQLEVLSTHVDPSFAHLQSKSAFKLVLDPRLTSRAQLDLLEQFIKSSKAFRVNASPDSKRFIKLEKGVPLRVFGSTEQLYTLVKLPASALSRIAARPAVLKFNQIRAIPVQAQLKLSTLEIELLNEAPRTEEQRSARWKWEALSDSTYRAEPTNGFDVDELFAYLAEFYLVPDTSLQTTSTESETFLIDHGELGSITFFPAAVSPQSITCKLNFDTPKAEKLSLYLLKKLEKF